MQMAESEWIVSGCTFDSYGSRRGQVVWEFQEMTEIS